MSLKPAVEICELVDAVGGGRQCIPGAALKRFDPSAVTASTVDQQYQVNWRTDDSHLDVNKYYRIRVLVGSALLGFADVDPVSSGSQLKNLLTNEYIPLLDGRTLPIKFRIENRALCAPGALACGAKTINLDQGGQIELLGAGEDFKLDIPAHTTATFNHQPVTSVTFDLEVCPNDINLALRTLGRCLRVATYFDATGSGELEFPNSLLKVSLCVLTAENPHPDRQEGFFTLHQRDGSLIRALPHLPPSCGTVGVSGWEWLKNLAAGFLTPRPAYAATRYAVLHVGAGGGTGVLGAVCTPPASPNVPGLMLSTTCPPSSPTAPSGPQRSAMATITPPQTVSDFQFALPAKMDYVDPDDASRSAPAGATLSTRVFVTDWDGTAVQGAHVTFIKPGELPTEIGSATSDVNGIAEFSWTINAGPNTVVATGLGIAAQNNYPEGTVMPFMPDIFGEGVQSAVALGTGKVTFTATGGAPAPIFLETFTDDAVDAPPGTPEIGSWSLTNPAGTILVRAAVGNLGAKPVELDHNAPGVAGSVKLRGTTAGTPPTSGVYLASWRSLVHSTDACFNGIVLRDAASLIIASVEYRPGGALTYNSNTLNASAGTWTRDVSQLFEITVDLNQKLTSLSIDGTPVASLQGVAFVQNAANIGQINMELGCVVSEAPQTYAWDDIVISRVSP